MLLSSDSSAAADDDDGKKIIVKKKLHIGCGPRYLPGFLHVDVKALPHVDIVCDMFDIHKHVAPGTVHEIYACHVVEHVSRHRVVELFRIFNTLLATGGVLRLAVPDIGKAIELYASGRYSLYPDLYGQFWGGQRDDHDYHAIGFDFGLLRDIMVRAGFDAVQRYDWRTFLPDGYDDYSRSYLPHMDFDAGELLSLNVVACKIKSVDAVDDDDEMMRECVPLIQKKTE
jgi:predicted SAM-dependent methyltransferase